MRLIDANEFEKRIKPYDTEDNMDKALYNFAHYHLITTPSAQPTQSNDSNTLNALNCISRQAAIGAHCELCPDNGKCNCDICPDVEAFQLLPSAQPEIIRCNECKHRHEAECPMYHEDDIEWDDDGYTEYDMIIHDWTKDDGYCDRGERRTDEQIR